MHIHCGGAEIITEASPELPFVPRRGDIIKTEYDRYRVIEIEVTYLAPRGMMFNVYTEKI